MTTTEETQGPWFEPWTEDKVRAGLAALRQEFPPQHVGKLPKGERKDSQAEACAVCGNRHKPCAMHLDFVGHAYVCDRLDEVDPHWVMEPRYDVDGNPLLRVDGSYASLQVSMTVLGITRYEVGQAEMGPGREWMKNLYSDCITRAAMRFGVARYLWQKETPITSDNFSSGPAPATKDELDGWVQETKSIVANLPDPAGWVKWKDDHGLDQFPIGATALQIEDAVVYARALAESPF